MASSLEGIVRIFFQLFNLLILARILLSWVQLDPSHPIVRFIHDATEPIMAPVRRMLPQSGMIDFSPMVVIIGSFVVESLVVTLIYALFPRF